MPWSIAVDQFIKMRPGHTPVRPIPSFKAFPEVELWAKLEGCNPSGSSKDRPAYRIIEGAIAARKVNEDTTIIESSSGNMALALAEYAGTLQLPFHCVTDERSLPHNRKILEFGGATVEMIDTKGALNPVEQRIERVKSYLKNPDYFWTEQYYSPLNPAAYSDLVEELVAQVPPFTAIFVPVSTGGSAAGIRDAFKLSSPKVEVIMVDAVGSAATHLQESAPRVVTGFGSSIRSAFLSLADKKHVVNVSDCEAIAACYEMLGRTSKAVGGSSGAVLAGCHKYLATCQTRPQRVVLFFADRGQPYEDTIYSSQWLEEHHVGGLPHLNLY